MIRQTIAEMSDFIDQEQEADLDKVQEWRDKLSEAVEQLEAEAKKDPRIGINTENL